MSCALIQVVNASSQNVEAGGIINPGTIVRRYGQCFGLSGNGITINGNGYFDINAVVTVAPTAAGEVVVQAYENGTAIPGAIATGTAAAADNPITLPIIATIRKACACSGMSSITFGLVEGAGNVTNISIRGEKA